MAEDFQQLLKIAKDFLTTSEDNQKIEDAFLQDSPTVFLPEKNLNSYLIGF